MKMTLKIRTRKIILQLLYITQKASGINLLSFFSIQISKGVKISKSYLAGEINISSLNSLTKTQLFGKVNIGNNNTINSSFLSGNIQIESNSNICNSQLNGNITIGNQNKLLNSYLNGNIETSTNSIIQGTTINGSFKAKENLKLYGTGIVINGNVEIGRYTTLNGPNFDIYTRINKIKIGSFCSIARNVSFQEYNHRLDRVSTYFMNNNIFNEEQEEDINSKGDIILENDVWIGTHCVILGGAHISTGSVVAANSVVSSFIPPYAIVGGSPAKVIKYRFEQDVINNLLQSKWWDWSFEKIERNKNRFQNQCTLDISRKMLN